MPSKTALLVIDVQEGMFNKKIPAYKGKEVVDNINALIAKAHAAGGPVFIIQHSGDKVFAEGSEDWQLSSDLRSDAGDILIAKHKPDAFVGTALEDHLKRLGVTRVVTTGFVTHGCVKATTLGAKERGYQAVLANDAHSSYSKDAAELIEKVGALLAQSGVETKTTKEIEF